MSALPNPSYMDSLQSTETDRWLWQEG